MNALLKFNAIAHFISDPYQRDSERICASNDFAKVFQNNDLAIWDIPPLFEALNQSINERVLSVFEDRGEHKHVRMNILSNAAYAFQAAAKQVNSHTQHPSEETRLQQMFFPVKLPGETLCSSAQIETWFDRLLKIAECEETNIEIRRSTIPALHKFMNGSKFLEVQVDTAPFRKRFLNIAQTTSDKSMARYALKYGNDYL